MHAPLISLRIIRPRGRTDLKMERKQRKRAVMGCKRDEATRPTIQTNSTTRTYEKIANRLTYYTATTSKQAYSNQ